MIMGVKSKNLKICRCCK